MNMNTKYFMFCLVNFMSFVNIHPFLSKKSPLCILFSNNWIPLSILAISWSIVSIITSVMHIWSFCTRAPSGFQYELNTLFFGKNRKDNFSLKKQDSLNYRHRYRYCNKYQKYRNIFLSPYRPSLGYMHFFRCC